MLAWKQPFIMTLIFILELNIKESKFDPFSLHFIRQKVQSIVKMNEVTSGNHSATKYKVCYVIWKESFMLFSCAWFKLETQITQSSKVFPRSALWDSHAHTPSGTFRAKLYKSDRTMKIPDSFFKQREKNTEREVERKSIKGKLKLRCEKRGKHSARVSIPFLSSSFKGQKAQCRVNTWERWWGSVMACTL